MPKIVITIAKLAILGEKIGGKHCFYQQAVFKIL